ncbi:MAG: hypothetical protein LBL75_01660 [Rickettsiales bacterium]|jgi:hypothetical protein|nr:hypothetical protein [Rickettsiales bacterium]
MREFFKKVGAYLARLFSDRSGDPSAKRYACAVFAITGIVLAACGFGVDIVGLFVAAALGENVVSIFEKGGTDEKAN